ncbi:S-layer homology domain-containing protein [Paenibacillus sp. 3LSP]|uniref:fibronectin type III domain-containing protein n=1 Tax=Paenibacillus sp. 3LSP TaxID=2800795 RepID=UPI0028FDBF14|nr:S-layer homology domain-containing protein [Paenibacillus sp. 3LSP]MDU0330481.1 S-layer homology domain-containing protein [Paenibacillus sp. 3LSP]
MNWIKKVAYLIFLVAVVLSGMTFVGAGKSDAAVYYYYNKYNVDTAGWSLINDGTASGQVYKSRIDSGVYSGDWLASNEDYYRIYNNYWIDGYGYISVGGSGNLYVYGWAGGLNSRYSNTAYYKDNVYYTPVRIEFYRPFESTDEGSVYTVYQLTTNPPKTRGTLVASDIKAIDGTYPNDGIHSDGYWYVKGAEVPNSLPQIDVIQSGNKSINLKSGFDTFTIAGTAVDSDNDTLSIRATINGVQKQVLVSNTSSAKNWSLTWRTAEFSATGTSSNIMITADDGRGGVVTTSYNGSLTIDKTPLFFWDKYTVSKTHNYIETDWVYEGDEDLKYGLIWIGPTTYNFDPISGRYTVPGSESYIRTSRDDKLYTLYAALDDQNTHYLRRWDITYYQPPGESTRTGTYIKVYNKYVNSVDVPTRGALVQSNVVDKEGTYPDNGIHSDGYWYVRKSISNMFPVLTVDSSDITANQSASKIRLKGTVSDSDGDSVRITAALAGITKSTSVTASGDWQLEWSTSEIPEGMYTGISIQADDGHEGIDKITYTGTIILDKTAPIISTAPENQEWTSYPISLTFRWSDQLSGLNVNERKYKLSNSQSAPTSWETADSDQLQLSIPGEGEWYLHIKAADLAGNEVTTVSGPYQYQKQPVTPTLHLNSVGDDWAEIGWSLPSGSFGGGYRYEIENTVTGQSWTLDYPTDRIREDGLAAGTTYKYRIKSTNYVGTTEWSDQFEVLTLPAPVDGLKVSFVPNNSGKVNVSFDDVESAVSYQLTIKEGSEIVYEEELNTAGTHQVTGLEGGKQYTVIVSAHNASGAGQSSVLGFLTLPAAPGEFQSVQIKETEVELSWTASPTATLYELLRDAVSRYSGSDLSYTDTGLNSGTEYDYSISAKNESGFGDIAYLNGVLTLPGKTKITVDEIGKDVVNFSIDTVRGAEKYVVLVNGVKEKELAPETKQFEIDSLNSGTEYTFEVYAENRSGTGVANRVTVRTLPDKPGELLNTDISDTTAKLSWQPVTGADKYKVTVTDDVYFETSGTDISLSDLRAGETYQLKVQAGNASGYGEAAAKTLLTLPASPDVRIDNVQATQFTLAWNEVISATKYVVHNEQDEIIGETKETSYTITDLKPGSTHTVYVSAVNETGEGKKSSFTQRTLPGEWGIDPNDPQSSQPITVGDRDEHSVVIVIDPVEGADQYKIVDDAGNVVGIITAPETAKEIGGLESAKEYDNWSLIPINDVGEGQATPVPPFVTLPSSNFEVSVGNPTTSSLTVTVDSQLTNEIFVYAVNGKEVHRGKEKSYTASNLSSDKGYTFTVWTENSAGDKTKPKSATGKTLSLPSYGGSNLLQPKPPVDEQEAAHPHTAEPQTHTDQAGFEDIDRSFAKEEILALYAMGIVKGVSDSKFEPDRQVTRVEFASMLVRAMELQEASDAALTFEDVQRTAWYAPELSAAVLNGVAKGISAKEFRPLDPITREQAAKMIANAAYQGNVPTAQANYKDAKLIAWWAKPEVAALSTERVITGYPDQTFKPKRDMTRAECAALIYRALRLYQ